MLKFIKKTIWKILDKLGISGHLAIHFNSALTEVGWFRSFALRRAVNKAGQPLPWLTYSFIHFLTPRLRKHMTVFEYGCGSSTFWFSQQVQSVYSCEHNPVWFDFVKKTLPSNCYLTLEPDCENYPQVISKTVRTYDLILVDGIERAACLTLAPNYLKPDGVIVLDNSERKEYDDAKITLSQLGFKSIEFYGMAPGVHQSTITTLFYRPDNCLSV